MRMGRFGDEDGLTLVELLVASAMSVVLLGAIGSMVVSAMNNQPKISERAANIQTARWVMERLTREIRNGVAVDSATASSVSFRAYVRRTACGGGVPTDPNAPAIVCQITYTCNTTTCTRIEGSTGVSTAPPGTSTRILNGINSSDVFTYSPSASAATYVGVTLRIPNPSGSSALTVSDGASLRNATLTN